MSIITISPDLIEVNTLLLQPSQSFSSSSSGMVGSLPIYPRSTSALRAFKGSTPGTSFSETAEITDDDDYLYEASQQYLSGATDISKPISAYISKVNDSNVNATQFLRTFPVRIGSAPSVEEPTFDMLGNVKIPYDRNEWINLQRRAIVNCLMPLHRVENSLSFNAYGNYNSLNFVSSSNFGTSSALIFPNFPDSSGFRDYTPPNAFTLDFFIKPRAPVEETEHFRASTIFHLSSSICVSLISGSLLDVDRKPANFRIMLQLSRSADISPSNISVQSLPLGPPQEFTYVTPDTLLRDSWHRVTIRWGSQSRSLGTGSIKVDDQVTRFSANVPSISTGMLGNALIIGNYYDSGDDISKFFNTSAAARYGTEVDPSSSVFDPAGFDFNHQMNAEIHHVSFFKRYLNDSELININDLYQESALKKGPSFFLPLFFTSSTPGSVFTYNTPKEKDNLETDSPVSYQLALGYNATFLNLQNFVIDFARRKQPRAYNLSEGIEVPYSFDSREGVVDNLLMLQSHNRARNFSILPCDDGNFEPSFGILDSDNNRFQNIGISKSTMLISMDALAPPGLAPEGEYVPGQEFADLNYDGTDAPLLPLYQDMNYLTQGRDVRYPGIGQPDNSSNRMIIFSIPSLYYMTRIVPGSFTISDTNLSGSGGIPITLKDDGRGNLYRSNTVTPAATWNKVGSIFYSHGIACIISPHIPYFGKSSYEMNFRGEMRKTVANFMVPASADSINRSFNSSYKEFPPTDSVSEQADSFVYISGINLHDKNFNVVMRARLAQVIQKREGDEIVFRLRYDF